MTGHVRDLTVPRLSTGLIVRREVSPGLLTFVALGWRQARQERFVLLFPLFTFVLLTVVFNNIFAITPFEELDGTLTLNAEVMTWYVALTELVAMAAGRAFRDLRDVVLRGEFASSLHRPMSMIVVNLCETFGRLLFDLPIFALTAGIVGFTLTGSFPLGPGQCAFLVVSVLLSTMLIHVMMGSIALIEVWSPQARPAYWMTQKAMFFLGGLILPIAIYPEAVKTIAWATPFPAILTVPARIVFDPPVLTMIAGIGLQVFWLVMALWLLFHVESRATRTILTRGD